MKLLKKWNLVILFLLLTHLISCQNKNVATSEDGCEYDPCSENRKSVRTVLDEKGTIGYDSEWKKYFISIESSSQSVDNFVQAIPCNLPEELQKVGAKVVVSGTLKVSCNDPKPYIGGQQIYYIQLNQIKLQ
ncbi:MAG: hypothetical protein EAZ55_02495 [Cytophagales bacterium]|nr:MAG: hypothetical protein EAZ55_02495 [Cytophagales bacterium]